MNRRSFLGWLGLGASTLPIALYADAVDPTKQVAVTGLHTSDGTPVDPKDARTFVLKNEGDRPMTISYIRLETTSQPARHKRYAPHAILLPGEELRIVASVMAK